MYFMPECFTYRGERVIPQIVEKTVFYTYRRAENN